MEGPIHVEYCPCAVICTIASHAGIDSILLHLHDMFSHKIMFLMGLKVFHFHLVCFVLKQC